MIRVVLPHNLRTLSGAGREVELELRGPVTQGTIIDALEETYPSLRGTIRDAVTRRRRPLVRFYACEEDWSDQAPDAALPDDVASGKQPFLIIGAMSGG